MGPENNVGLGGCWIMECLLPYLCMVTVPHIKVGLERMLDYRGVGLGRFHCIFPHRNPSYSRRSLIILYEKEYGDIILLSTFSNYSCSSSWLEGACHELIFI